MAKSFLKFCPSGEISPNMVTLVSEAMSRNKQNSCALSGPFLFLLYEQSAANEASKFPNYN